MYFGKEQILNGLDSKCYQKICSKKFRKIDKIISPSEWLVKEHQKRNVLKNKEVVIIPNPIEGEVLNEKSRNNYDEVCRFLFVGQIEKHKGIFLLIEAFKELKRLQYRINSCRKGKRI